jgi:23S rRNA pseudouridine2605 synthase
MPEHDTSTRLNKYLALQLGISRREADLYIEKGRVRVNGTQATLGSRVSEGDTISVDGTPLDSAKRAFVYLALHKPAGYVCSRRRQGEFPTIYELLPDKYQELKAVGRLDKDSSGLILLSNDGDFAFRMTHPKFHKTKVYEVSLDSDLAPLHQQMIGEFGVTLDDGVSKLGLMRLSDIDRRHWQVTMSEGRNRQIRRTFLSLGYTVVTLHRTTFGPYSLDDIKKGEHMLVDIR